MSSALLWDRSDDPPADPGAVLCWRSYSAEGVAASVPAHLEAHAERIRSRYLSFIHELGQTPIAGKSVVEHLDRGGGQSFWWMSTLAEKSPLKSPRIYDCLRLFALEELLIGKGASTLTLVSADRALALAVRTLCHNLSIGFRWRRSPESARRWTARRLYEALPFALKGLLSLRHVIRRWPLRNLRDPAWFFGPNAVFICSYFIHLDPDLCAHGKFRSGQWESLPELLHELGRQTNWLQMFLFSAAVPDTQTAISWVRMFHADAGTQGRHAFLDSYLSVSLVWQALRSWLWLAAASWRLRRIAAAFRPRDSALWLWPLLREDWHISLTGQTGMSNCLVLAQFEAALARLPRQTIGLYLCENQGWEKALLWCWRKHGHGQIIGVQHATAPFWHLYYFDDPRSLRLRGRHALPLPDRLAVNGAAVYRAFAAAGYPQDRLIEVEALRYLQLRQLLAPRQARAAASDTALRVLILGDLIPSSMRHLLRLIEAAVALLPGGHEFALKPHPAYTPDVAAFPALPMTIVRRPLSEILADYDIAIAANSTSAAVEAYVAGLPVIIGLDGNALNLSPLRDRPEVRFVSTRQDLAAALRAAAEAVKRAAIHTRAVSDGHDGELFFLDPQLPRWRQLLQATAAATT